VAERVELDALDLAALLCSRVCHDIISPVGAIINGLEVLDEDNGEMRDFAFSLIRKSAAQASAKLQFARLAFGAAGSAGAEIDLADAEKVARGYMEGEQAAFDRDAPRIQMPKHLVKLVLNLVLLSVAAIPRG
jgi:histidine phosphotransferase ChpT